jgi:hypothetical protein
MLHGTENLIGNALLGWLALSALLLVGYLLRLEIREFRRNRRLDAERERLGLRRAY